MHTLSNAMENMIITSLSIKFILVFNDYQYSPYITSNISDNRTMSLRQKFCRKGD